MCYQLWREERNCNGARSMVAVFNDIFLWGLLHSWFISEKCGSLCAHLLSQGQSWGRADPAHGIRCLRRPLSWCPLLFLSSSQLFPLNTFYLRAMSQWVKPALHLGHVKVKSCWCWHAHLCLCDCSVYAAALCRWIGAAGTMTAFGFTCFPGSEESLSPSPEWEEKLCPWPLFMFYRRIISCEREKKKLFSFWSVLTS